ncbi:mariner transposase [Trichonephila clavipes]|nr:mariner transposase [Trichonephila clavipes]
MEIPLRTAYGQAGRCDMQPKAKYSLRAQAQLMRTETVETVELVKVKQKLRTELEREKKERESFKPFAQSWIQEEARCLGATPINTKNIMDRISICEALAKRNEIDPFLKRMVTGDEKWVTYDNIVRKRSWSKCGEVPQ